MLHLCTMKDQALGPQTPAERRAAALNVRICAARAQEGQVHPVHMNNGDDERYPDRRGSFTKGLPHDSETGLVNQAAYASLLNALKSGVPEHFERIPLGGQEKLVNPQAGLAFDMEGGDSHSFTILPAPRFESDEIAAEIVENYWMALLRDVHFDEYTTHTGAASAAKELTSFSSEFKGPKESDSGEMEVTPKTLFRGLTPGDTMGPYISQFLMLPVPFGAQGYDQRMLTPKKGINFGTTWDKYIAIQNGQRREFNTDEDFEDKPVYIRNGRDLSQWVHIDVLFQAYFNAMLILLQGPNHPTPLVRTEGRPNVDPVHSGLGEKNVAQNPGNPYLRSMTQVAFGTFGAPYIAATLCEVATRALKAVWFQKWYVHRRLRPEVFAARIHSNRIGKTNFPMSEKAMKAAVLDHVKAENNSAEESYLLPLAFPEGSPSHPAYGAGHGTVAGACVTLLKAFFDENAPIKHPKRISANGQSLEDYDGPDKSKLTVGGELNKLASNVAIGRNIAGVHWRSDATESLFLGEQVALALLRDHRQTFNERFGDWEFTTFAGKKIMI